MNTNETLNDQLDSLQNNNYISKIEMEKQLKMELKEKDDIEKKNEKLINKSIKNEKRIMHQEKINKQKKIDEEINEDQDEEEEQFQGKNRRELNNTILKYQELFPSELQKFKIKKNSSAEELKQYILEIQCIIETSCTDSFITDSIYTAMSYIEPITSKTKYNISGLTLILKSNKEFNKLCKQLMLKYGCFSSSISIEYQTLLIIISSVYITITTNSNRKSIEKYLDEKI